MQGVSWLFVLVAIYVLSPVESFIPSRITSLGITGSLKAKHDAGSNVESSLELVCENTTTELDSVLTSLPEDQKYELLVQSYAVQVLDKPQCAADARPMDHIFRLYGEMIDKKLTPTARSCRALLDCAAKYTSCDVVGKAVRLGIASSRLKVFGVGVGMLVDPLTAAKQVLPGTDLPQDERELEVVLASVAFALGTCYVTLQAGSVFDQGLHNWGSLVFGVVVAAGGLDIALMEGQSLRKAAAGLDRLVLADAERESHSEAAAFLTGYLLGVPSFCYQPDVPEALRMLADYRESMSVFKRKAARDGRSPPVSASDATCTSLAYVEPDVGGGGDTPGLALGRVLVWMLAPVAAEQLRYGQAVVSDPRNARRLLLVLDRQQGEAGGFKVAVPAEGTDRETLLRWAYYEAVALCKQYGELLEDVRDFLHTGTSSVGECCLLIEQVLTR